MISVVEKSFPGWGLPPGIISQDWVYLWYYVVYGLVSTNQLTVEQTSRHRHVWRSIHVKGLSAVDTPRGVTNEFCDSSYMRHWFQSWIQSKRLNCDCGIKSSICSKFIRRYARGWIEADRDLLWSVWNEFMQCFACTLHVYYVYVQRVVYWLIHCIQAFLLKTVG